MATTTTNSFNYKNMNVEVTDNKGSWKENLPNSSCIVQVLPGEKKVLVTVPEPIKRDTTKNPALYTGEQTKMQVTVRKDGSYGFSWTPKAGELKILGIQKVVKEFKEAMTKYFEAIN